MSDRIVIKDGVAFRKARRSEAKPLIGLYSESGAGKTYSALLLARGFVGPQGRIAMIETESGRGEAYEDLIPGGYDVWPLRDDYSPKNYGMAIAAAEAAKYDALIVDSASHEWEAAGGVLSMAADNEAAGRKGPLVWQRPKMEHQREFMLRLAGCAIPLVIICMRAKYPMEEVAKGGKKEWQRSTALSPKQSEDILFELFVHGWIDRDAHAFHGTKYSREDLRAILVDGQPITQETGRLLAQWSAGGSDPIIPGRIESCASLEALQALWEALTDDQRAKHKPAFVARKRQIADQPQAKGGEAIGDGRDPVVVKPAQPQQSEAAPAVSFATLVDRMRSRSEMDVLGADADLIQYLPVGQQVEAAAVYHECIEKLEGAA